MKKTLFALCCSGSLLMVACGGGSACEDYINAVSDCYVELGDESSNTLDESVCEGVDNSADDYYTCLADSYGAGDCSSTDGLTEIATELANCTY